MSIHTTRRNFLTHAAYAGALLSLPRLVRAAPASEKVIYGAVGCGGKGLSDLTETAESKYVQVAAICDVNQGAIKAVAGKFPQASVFSDWRKLLEVKDLQAITVSTPDHMHAPISIMAMRRGLHVYCQKPLTWSVHEARRMTLLARQNHLVTQMGIQLHSSSYLKLAVAAFRAGAIGKVREVHVWTDRPIWPQGIGRPAGSNPVPEGLDWDAWIGVAPMRPYVEGVYHAFNWRGWEDFGTGALGDMGCHIIDPVAEALELGPPTQIWSDGEAPNGETYPTKSVIHYEFPRNGHTAGETLPMTWYDGHLLPPASLWVFSEPAKMRENGALLVGEKGTLFCAYDHRPLLGPSKVFADYKWPEVTPNSHYEQWTDAIRGQGKPTTNFDYAGPLTETVLLGNIALHYPGRKLRWDAPNLTFPDAPEANRRLRRTYRKGWEVPELG